MIRKGSNRIWVTEVLTSTLAVVISYVIINLTAGSFENSTIGFLCLILTFACLVPITLAIIAVFKLRGWLKLIPLVSLPISIVVLGLSVFAYGLSGYGS